MNVLQISISLIVLAAIIYIFNYNKKASAKKVSKVVPPPSESTQKPTQSDSLKSISEPEPGPYPETKNVHEEPIESISYTITTGENEFYKMKLRDPRWIELSKKIKARDKYRCVECGSDGCGIVVLESIEDLEPIVKSPEVYKIVKDVFDNKSQFSYDSYKTLPSAYYIEENCNEYILVSKEQIKELSDKYIFTFSRSNPIDKNPIETISKHMAKDRVVCRTYFIFENQYSRRTIIVEYIEDGNTDNQIFLRHAENYRRTLAYIYQGILTFNSLSIIFPLYSLDKKQALNVHHKVYYENREPWDFEEPYSELITLCHKCHMEAHKQPIPVKRRNSTIIT